MRSRRRISTCTASIARRGASKWSCVPGRRSSRSRALAQRVAPRERIVEARPRRHDFLLLGLAPLPILRPEAPPHALAFARLDALLAPVFGFAQHARRGNDVVGRAVKSGGPARGVAEHLLIELAQPGARRRARCAGGRRSIELARFPGGLRV